MDDRELVKIVALGRMLDFYGPLLTAHRRELLRMYCEEDLSLTEIARIKSDAGQRISRQGVYDAVMNAQKQLMEYEEKLGLIERYDRMAREADICLQALEPGGAGLETAKAALQRMIEY
ncbi:MAG: hypothetical protein ACOYI5_08870 [Christensenellales bacterium]|jgi:predicted DNA-binding protein YlxM (UPF0122 family)